MPLLQYKAMDERGRTTVGHIEAVNVADLELRLARMGLDLINFKEAKTRTALSVGRRIKRRDLIGFCLHLEQLVSSGVPLMEGLVDLRDSVDNPRLREVIAGMVESIEGGKTLSSAMGEFPQVFDLVFVNLIKAGEISGQVGEVLRRVTENLKWQDEQAAHIRRLLMYPAIVGVVVLILIMFLMGYLVPQLVSFITIMGQELPTHTRVLMAISHVFVSYWYLIVTIAILAIVVLALAKRMSPSLQYTLDALKLKVWVIGPILKKIILARFANYFALMYASGITVLECIRISEGLMGNKAIAEAVHRAGRQIADGASIRAGFESTALFPPLVLRMLRVGENTGALDAALMHISYFYNRDVEESMQHLQTMIGPTMTLLVGATLFWVIVSVLGPIYDLVTTVQY